MNYFVVIVGVIVSPILVAGNYVWVEAAGKQQNVLPVSKGDYLGQNPPGQTHVVFAPGTISHGSHEHHLTISPDGDEMFYASSSGDHEHYVIIHVKRENNVWREPEVASFSGKYKDMGPRFSPDGEKLFFCNKSRRDSRMKSMAIPSRWRESCSPSSD